MSKSDTATNGTPAATATKGGKHKATYATDKKKGGYLIRVVGPDAEKFVSREVPVHTKAGGTPHMEKLIKLIWSGKDTDTGENCALYKFESKPRETDEIVF